MADIISKIIGSLIDNAQKLASLSATAVWAFFTLMLILYNVYDVRLKKKAAEEAWAGRLKEADADALMAKAVEQLANEIKEMRHALKDGGYIA